MIKKILLCAAFFALFFLPAFCANCAGELQEKDGTCIYRFYRPKFGTTDNYYSCNRLVESTWWYYETCTATIANPNNLTTADSGSIVAQYWSNDANKVSACAGRDEWICNTNPQFGFSTNMDLAYVGLCDSSEQTCVKCSASGLEIAKYDGSGLKITNIIGLGNNLCESGCGASNECDEQPQGYNIGNAGCNNSCQWKTCNNYKFNGESNECFASCQSNEQCFEQAVCDLAINPNTCLIDNEFPKYHEYFHTDMTETPDDSIIIGDVMVLSAYWTDNLYIQYADLQINRTGTWESLHRLENINSAQAWTNYTIDTINFDEGTVQWRILATDRRENINSTPISSFQIYNKSANFSITLNLADESQLIEFSSGAKAAENIKPDNSLESELIGEITLIHDGRGISSKYSFKIGDNEIPSTIRIKLTNSANPNENKLYLSNNFENPNWCQDHIRGDECRIWVWMDADYGNLPAEYLQSLMIKNEANE